MTAAELAWISQLVDALDTAWEQHHSNHSSFSTLLYRLNLTRSPMERRDEVSVEEAAESTVVAAHLQNETDAESVVENRGQLSPRAALAAARAALAEAEAEAAAIDWNRYKVSAQASSMLRFDDRTP